MSLIHRRESESRAPARTRRRRQVKAGTLGAVARTLSLPRRDWSRRQDIPRHECRGGRQGCLRHASGPPTSRFDAYVADQRARPTFCHEPGYRLTLGWLPDEVSAMAATPPPTAATATPATITAWEVSTDPTLAPVLAAAAALEAAATTRALITLTTWVADWAGVALVSSVPVTSTSLRNS